MKKKVLFCIQNFNIGGPQKSLLSLLHEFDYQKYDVDLMVWSQEGSLIEYLPKQVNLVKLENCLRYVRLSKNEIIKNSIKLLFSKHHKLVYSAFKAVFKYRKSMEEGRQLFWMENKDKFPLLEKEYDVAIAVSGGNLAYFIIDCVIAKEKFTWVRSDYRVYKRNKEIDRIYFNKVDGIITVSNLCKDILDAEFPEFKGKTQVFYNLLPINLYNIMKSDTSVIRNDNQSKIILSVSRLDPDKGLDLAIDAMSILKSKGVNAKWYVLGDGGFRKKLQSSITKKGLDEDFILLGFKENTFSFIERCDIFVHPSRFEGKSNSVDEAKFACKPIVVTNYSTVKEQITHEYNGIIVDMVPKDIANAIIELLENTEMRNNLVVNLSKNNYSMFNNISDFEKIIEIKHNNT